MLSQLQGSQIDLKIYLDGSQPLSPNIWDSIVSHSCNFKEDKEAASYALRIRSKIFVNGQAGATLALSQLCFLYEREL